MKFYVDGHIHSHFSRATSKDLDLDSLFPWALLKGIQVIGTGDFVHPGWFENLQRKLEPAEEGFYKLKSDYATPCKQNIPSILHKDVRFMLSCEISNIYKKNNKVRRVHNVIFCPHFEAVQKIQKRIECIGNIYADGRPILGLDSRDLLEIVLESDPLSYLVPAHIWTPWFSILGSKGGFDSIHDCFGDLTQHIFALETGLSSDPPMNWRLNQLDPYALISNSDAHSAAKLGRELTIYDTEFSYRGIHRALSSRDNAGLVGTIEFFPEEGKYHYDGHKECGVRFNPQETKAHNGLCPKCGKSVTVGVMARVEELADYPQGRRSPRARPFFSFIPLQEIIAEAKSMGVQSKAVQRAYRDLVFKLGSELAILKDIPIGHIKKIAGALVAEGICRMREGRVRIAPGFDGEYGTIKIFSPKDRESADEQMTLFL